MGHYLRPYVLNNRKDKGDEKFEKQEKKASNDFTGFSSNRNRNDSMVNP